MKLKVFPIGVNRNPLVFEELATSLASLASYCEEGDMGLPIAEFEQRYTHALGQPANYEDISELTGQSLNTGDRRSGRAAWLLMNTQQMQVCAVHSLLWHNKGGKYFAPILDQVGLALGKPPALDETYLQTLGEKTSVLDVVGVKDGGIWLVQSLHAKKLLRSAVRENETANLFGDSVFHNVVLGGKSLETLYCASDVMREAFPGVDVLTMAIVLHPELPDFELYILETPKDHPRSITLREEHIVTNSLDYRGELLGDHQALWTLPERFDNLLFKGLAPCRGGRTLNMRASIALRQLRTEDLLRWKERDFIEKLNLDFNYDLPRDKVRHDLVDRLVGQGYVKKWGNHYSLTVKGMARYLYSLAKYTTLGIDDPLTVLEVCILQRNRVFGYYGCS